MLPKTVKWMLLVVVLILLLFVLNTHVVKTKHGVTLVKKSRWALIETLVDVHEFTQADLEKHPLLKRSLEDGKRQDILSEITKPDTSIFDATKDTRGAGSLDPNRYINRANEMKGRVEQQYKDIGKVDEDK